MRTRQLIKLIALLVLVLCGSFCIAFYKHMHIDKQLVIIPNGYIGRVAILYNQPKGNKTEYTDDGRRILRIPPCGILKTQFSAPYGVIRSDAEQDYFKFCYRAYPSGAGKADTIAYLTDYSHVATLPQDKIFVFERGMGGFGIGDVQYNDVEEFFVDSIKNMTKYKTLNFDQADLDKCN